MELTVETQLKYSFKMSISKPGPVLAFIKVDTVVEKHFLTQIRVSKKAGWIGEFSLTLSCSLHLCLSEFSFSSQSQQLFCHLEFVINTPDENS